MKLARNWLWYLFIAGSYLLVILVIIYNLSPRIYYVAIIGIGLTLYALKLKDVNDADLSEINAWTIIYYGIIYIIIVAAAVGLWSVINTLFLYIDPVYFRKVFPTDDYFDIIARRGIIIGSLHSIPYYVESKTHSAFDLTQFTSKVRLLEVIVITVAAGWVLVIPYTVTLFIMIVAATTAPDPVRLWWARFMKTAFSRDVNLERQKSYNNNWNDGYREKEWDQYLVGVLSLVLILPVKVTISVHAPVAIFLLGFEAVTEPLRSLPSRFL